MRIASNEMELVDFKLFEDRSRENYEGVYGINVAKVSGIVAYTEEIFETPGSPDYMLGMFDLVGDVLPLIDLTKWMNIKPKKMLCVIRRLLLQNLTISSLGLWCTLQGG